MVNVYVPPSTSSYAPASFAAVLQHIVEWTAQMRLRHGTFAATVICGDFNARAGVLAHPGASDDRVDSRGTEMCRVLRLGGFELVPATGGGGIRAPFTRRGTRDRPSTLDYIWAAWPAEIAAHDVPSALLGECIVHECVSGTSDHSLLEACICVPG